LRRDIGEVEIVVREDELLKTMKRGENYWNAGFREAC
jgi:hypothetical protein